MPVNAVDSKKPWFKRWWGVAAIVFAVLVIVGVATDESDSADPEPAEAAVPTQTAPVETVSAEQAAADQAAKEAEAAKEAAEKQAEAERAEAREKARVEAEKAKTDPSTYETVSPRGWSLIVKDPDAHVGKKIVLYGNVTQFDSATGTSAFLANTASQQKSEWYEYDENTLVRAADDDLFADVVEDDLVKMYVEVTGSESYDTQIGGNTTVPAVTVYIIKVTGSSA